MIVGEMVPGALLQSLLPGIESRSNVIAVDVWGPGVREMPGRRGVLMRRIDQRRVGQRVVEAVEQHQPEAVLIVKGRGLSSVDIEGIRRLGVPVACYYPDNPWWTTAQEPNALGRLLACDVAVTFAERQASRLRDLGGRTAVLPFGYDPRWFPLTDPAVHRSTIAFLGTWSHRRQRYLAALKDVGVPLVVHGTGWEKQDEVPAGEPITEEGAGQILAGALIGVNLLHPQCSGSHNMRTREIAACGALQISDPGSDGSPLRDTESYLTFRSPEELRERVCGVLEDRAGSLEVARTGQQAIADDTYFERGRQLHDILVSTL